MHEGNVERGELGNGEWKWGAFWQLTDDVLQFGPVVVNKLLIGHSQKLMIERSEIECWSGHCV